VSVTNKHVDFFRRKDRLLNGGGNRAVEKQMALGKLTARDRITALLDVDSFYEFDLFVEHRCRDFDMDKRVLPGDGVITGTGSIMGYPVCIYAQDFTVAGGSLGLMHARKITKIMDHAIKMGMPIIGINDSGGARIQEGVDSLAGYGEIFYRNTLASGIVPQISVILGPCAGGAVYSPALTDFVFVVDKISKMFITGPEVIKTVLGEEISMEDLGGARVHSEISGNAHFYARNELECFHKIKQLFTFIPWNNKRKAERYPAKPPKAKFDIERVVPMDSRKPYDVRNVICAVCDNSEFLDVHANWAANLVVGFARIDGETVGIVANQPMVLAGVLDVDSSDKGARFIGSVTRSVSPLSRSSTCRGTSRESNRNTPVSSGTARSSCTLSARPPCRRSPSSSARRTGAGTSPCARAISEQTLWSPGPPRKSPLWARRGRRISYSRTKSRAHPIPRRCAVKRLRSTRRNSQIRTLRPPPGTSMR
jgi:methylmalonyl-CoA decarboxylase subunit alpha